MFHRKTRLSSIPSVVIDIWTLKTLEETYFRIVIAFRYSPILPRIQISCRFAACDHMVPCMNSYETMHVWILMKLCIRIYTSRSEIVYETEWNEVQTNWSLLWWMPTVHQCFSFIIQIHRRMSEPSFPISLDSWFTSVIALTASRQPVWIHQLQLIFLSN